MDLLWIILMLIKIIFFSPPPLRTNKGQSAELIKDNLRIYQWFRYRGWENWGYFGTWSSPAALGYEGYIKDMKQLHRGNLEVFLPLEHLL